MNSLICAEEVAYNELKQRILDGKFMPGTRLVHRNLAKELGISPNPVVLALRMLERDGLVVNTPGLGACVRTWTKEEIIDLHHLRASLEGLAARLCAERATTTDLEAIVTARDEFRQSAVRRDVEKNIPADANFHISVVRGAHCPDLERTIENLCIIHCSMKIFSLTHRVPRFFFPGHEFIHDAVVSAIENRDGDSAEKEGRKHVEESLARNIKWIEEIDVVVRTLGKKGRDYSLSFSASAK